MYRWTVILLVPILLALAMRSVLATAPPVYLGQEDLALQSTPVTCGPAALAYILRKHGLSVTENELAALAGTTNTGTTMLGLHQAAEHFGFRSHGVSGGYGLLSEITLPAIGVFQEHFVVIAKVTPSEVEVGDPLVGFMRYSPRAFMKAWQGQILVIER